MPPHRPRPRAVTARFSPWPLRLLATLLVLLTLGQAAWRFAGGTTYVVSSTSMCPSMCVGALDFDRPLTTTVHVGETVTFEPPGLASLYTHRVVATESNGDFRTKGLAANRVDPWTATPQEVRGVVVASVTGLGWLAQALPFLDLGALALYVLRRYASPRLRSPLSVFVLTMLAVVPLWRLRPLVRGVEIASRGLAHHRGVITLVNSGLLPARVRAVGTTRTYVVPSFHRLTLTGPLQRDGAVHVIQTAALNGWWWAVVLVFATSPLWGFLWREVRHARRVVAHQLSPALDSFDLAPV